MDFKAGWKTIQRGTDKVVSFVDADGLNRDPNTPPFTVDEMMHIYGTVYNLCTQNNGYLYAEELYSCYTAFFQRYINAEILPAVREKSGEHLLREVVKRWRDYKFITRWVARFFLYLDRYFISRLGCPTMSNTALIILHSLAYEEIKGQIISAVLTLIDKDRDGNSVDRALIKEVLEIVYDPQSETLSTAYQTDFEPALLDSSCVYYHIKTDNWLQNLPYPEYMSQVTECLNAEKFRAMQYLHLGTVSKLLELLNRSSQSDVSSLANKVQQLELGSNILQTVMDDDDTL